MKTRDLKLVVALVTLGFKIIDFENNPLKRGELFFFFDETPELIKARNVIYKGDARVDPMLYHENYRKIVSILQNVGNIG